MYHRCFPLSDVSNHVSCQHVHKFSMCWVRHFVERLWDAMIDQCCVCWCHVRKQMNCIGDKVQPKGVFRGALVTHMWHAVAKLINNHFNQTSDMPPDPPHPPTNPVSSTASRPFSQLPTPVQHVLPRVARKGQDHKTARPRTAVRKWRVLRRLVVTVTTDRGETARVHRIQIK